jgi:hypothetical protein
VYRYHIFLIHSHRQEFYEIFLAVSSPYDREQSIKENHIAQSGKKNKLCWANGEGAGR